MRISQSFAAGTPVQFVVQGNFLRIETALSPVDINFFRGGQELAENLTSATAGYYAMPDNGFDRIVITSSALQTVAVDIFAGRVGADRVVGSVAISNVNGSFLNSQKTVTSASAVLVSANAARRYLLIQNNNAVGNIYVRLDSTAATIGTGIKIPPGGSYELQGYVSNLGVHAIGDIASNANIVTVEG